MLCKKLIYNLISIMKKNKKIQTLNLLCFGTDFGLVLLSVRKPMRSFDHSGIFSIFQKTINSSTHIIYPMRKLLTLLLPKGNNRLSIQLPAFLKRYSLSTFNFPSRPLSYT